MRISRPVRAVVVLPLLAASYSVAAQEPERAGELKAFRDWVVGCDNTRSCVALGLGPDEGAGGAFLRVERSGDPAGKPRVTLSIVSDSSAARPALALRLDGKAALSAPLPARRDGDFLTASLDDADVGPFLDAVRNARTLQVGLAGRAKSSRPISLAGSAAALLYMDAAQLRAGTRTALVDRGAADAGSIPAPPPAPDVKAEGLKLINPPPALPAALKPSDDPSCADYPPIAIALSEGRTLWGVCELAAAYNFAYRFSIVAQGEAKPAIFAIPGRAPEPGDSPSTLVNPGLTNGRTTLAMLNKGRGIADCGETAQWAFDGAAFRLVSYARMDACRGVPPDAWPILYRAAAKAE